VPRPISSSAQIIPFDSIPLIFDFLMVKHSSPEYNLVPLREGNQEGLMSAGIGIYQSV
jgi:hypothetical protein